MVPRRRFSSRDPSIQISTRRRSVGAAARPGRCAASMQPAWCPLKRTREKSSPVLPTTSGRLLRPSSVSERLRRGGASWCFSMPPTVCDKLSHSPLSAASGGAPAATAPAMTSRSDCEIAARPCSVKDVTRESFRLDKPAAVSNRIAVTLRRIAPSEPTDTLRVPIINADIGAPSLPHTVAARPPTARQLNSRFIRKALARDTSYRKRGGPRLSASGPKSGDASTRR